ncbi:MAG: DUF1499 domain-containing protein [Pseudomonadota bacterium]
MLKRALESVFKAPKAQEFGTFSTLEKTGKPNQAILLPAVWDSKAYKDQGIPVLNAPEFDIEPADLLQRATAYLVSHEAAQVVISEPEKASLCARTRLMRYPDLIYLQALSVDADDGTSTIAAYSHSVYGYSDLGANTQRLSRLCASLSA